MNKPQISIIGAGSKHQGTGPWLARFFTQAGGNVNSILGRTRESVVQSQQDLKTKFSINCQGFTNFQEMIDKNRPDLLVIASPMESHLLYLQYAAKEKIPVFCEKPLVWNEDPKFHQKEAKKIVNDFEKQNLFLRVNTQWPESLKAFSLLHPNCQLDRAQNFKIELSPGSTGIKMLYDALPHAYSLMTALKGCGEIKNLNIKSHDKNYELSGVYSGQSENLNFSIKLSHVNSQPRPFSYEINSYRVERHIDLRDYSLYFKTNTGIFPIIDPVALRVQNTLRDFREPLDNLETKQIINEETLLAQTISFV